MPAEISGPCVHVVVEIEDAHEGAVGKDGIGGAGAMRPADAPCTASAPPDCPPPRAGHTRMVHRTRRSRSRWCRATRSLAWSRTAGVGPRCGRRAPSRRAARRSPARPRALPRFPSYPSRRIVSRCVCHTPRAGHSQQGFRPPSARAKALFALKRVGKNNKWPADDKVQSPSFTQQINDLNEGDFLELRWGSAGKVSEVHHCGF